MIAQILPLLPMMDFTDQNLPNNMKDPTWSNMCKKKHHGKNKTGHKRLAKKKDRQGKKGLQEIENVRVEQRIVADGKLESKINVIQEKDDELLEICTRTDDDMRYFVLKPEKKILYTYLPGKKSCNFDACLGTNEYDTCNCIYMRYSGIMDTKVDLTKFPCLTVDAPSFKAFVSSGSGRFAVAFWEAELFSDSDFKGAYIDLRYIPSDALCRLSEEEDDKYD